MHLTISADQHLPAGAENPWVSWEALNRLHKQFCRSRMNMLKWRYSNEPETCDCGIRQTIQHLLICPMMNTACSTRQRLMTSPSAVAGTPGGHDLTCDWWKDKNGDGFKPVDRDSATEASATEEQQVDVRPYWQVQNDLSSQNGLLLNGVRLIIPKFSRLAMLNKLHETHQVAVRCRSRAYSSVGWSGLSQQLSWRNWFADAGDWRRTTQSIRADDRI